MGNQMVFCFFFDGATHRSDENVHDCEYSIGIVAGV